MLDALGIKSAHILGASMGGMTAQEFALKYPCKCRKLILCCTLPGGDNVFPPTICDSHECQRPVARGRRARDAACRFHKTVHRNALGLA
ncbi:MAG: alpha/beta fold hydrolase [Candidatus Lindowbacteria bacterium]|nr:alpha/beta fold hydrolase [Candidatus Lindowbacteria bacterium]